MEGGTCPLNTARWCPVFSERCLKLNTQGLHCVLYKDVFFLEEEKPLPKRRSDGSCPLDPLFFCPFHNEEACQEHKDSCILWYRLG
jgi:hypothetical protein